MKFSVKSVRMTVILAALCVLGYEAPSIQAQTATEKLTTAKEVLARYVEVTGGLEKYKDIKGMSQEATMSIAQAGVEGKMEMKYAGTDRLLVNVDMGAAGTESSGIFDGTGWSESAMTGTRLVTGKELEQLKSQMDMRQYYEPEAVYKDMELLDEVDVNGQACYTLKLTRQSGSVEEEFYSVESGLKLKSKMTAETAMGALPIEVFYDEYKEYSGLQFPKVMTQKLPNGMEILFTLNKFELNPKFDDSEFEFPEGVKKLVEKQKKNSN